MSEKHKSVGKSEIRKDAYDKVTGAAQYTADIPMDAQLHGAVARSAVHAARIIEINPSNSAFTESMTDLFLQGPAAEVSKLLDSYLF